MTPRILVTGINGFVGNHLTRELKQNGCDVIGVGREEASHDGIADQLSEYIVCDFTNPAAVEKLDFSDVTAIIHLAGLASQGQSFEQPALYTTVNTIGTVNLLEHALRQNAKTRFVVISTGAVYDPAQTMPITEEGVVSVSSPYIISKRGAELFSAYYQGRGLDVVVVRPFNHIGPGQGPGFILPDMALQLRGLKDTSTSVLPVGNIDTRRDYTDVRDVVRAYRLLCTTPKLNHGLYNICSGRSVAGREILEHVAKALLPKGLEGLELQTDPAKIRPNDPPEIYGSAAKLTTDTGWQPEVDLETTIKDYLANL